MATITPFSLNLNKEKIVSWLHGTQAVSLSLFPRKTLHTLDTLRFFTWWPGQLMLRLPELSTTVQTYHTAAPVLHHLQRLSAAPPQGRLRAMCRVAKRYFEAS